MPLLTNDSGKLALLSSPIAWPLAHFAMQCWLEYFAHRVGVTPMVSTGRGAIVLCIARVKAGGIAVRGTTRKPELALRYERKCGKKHPAAF